MNPPATWETWVWSLGWEDPLEKGNATHSSVLTWRIPWTVESTGLQRAGCNWATYFHFTLLSAPIHSTNNQPKAWIQSGLHCSASNTGSCVHRFQIMDYEVFTSENIRPGRHPQGQSRTGHCRQGMEGHSQLPVLHFVHGLRLSPGCSTSQLTDWLWISLEWVTILSGKINFPPQTGNL